MAVGDTPAGVGSGLQKPDISADCVGKEEGAEERYNKSENGWDKVIKGLKELVEGEK